MPPLPKPRTGAARGSGNPSTGARERAGSSESSSAPPTAASRSRSTKASVTKEQLARMYMMLGTMLMPFGRFYPAIVPVGENLRTFANDAADAWMELAAKDKRVMEILESLVGASTWGNVIGIHLAIFASAIPMGSYMNAMPQGNAMEDELEKQGKAMGMSDEEIAEAKAAMRQSMPAQDTGRGGPGDTVRATPDPEQVRQAEESAITAPPVGQSRSAIVTPQELGVTQAGMDEVMPADHSPPNGRA